MNKVRSSDPRPGDRCRILLEESIWTGLEGTIRNVYRTEDGLAVTVVVHPNDVSTKIRESVLQAPDGGYHILCNEQEIDIIQRRTFH